jgi:2-amino-4-hydroxy-6-hydroxymethyldihydropteridine diphosphokinase
VSAASPAAGPTRRAYVGIGANLGDRLAHLQGAVDGLGAAPDVTVVAVSPVYETDPVGPDQPDYLNAVVALDTALAPPDLLALAHRLEAAAHRVREERWGPRTLDVDLLLVGDDVVATPDLQVPHPRAAERAFVLVPLADLDPGRAEGLDPGAVVREGPDRASVRPTGLRLSVPE